MWECPDLFPLAVDGDKNNIKWVLVVNINPGGIAGGSAAQYFIGDFDGKKFTSGNGEAVITDQIFPDPSSTGVEAFAEGGTATLDHLQAWRVKSIWL